MKNSQVLRIRGWLLLPIIIVVLLILGTANHLSASSNVLYVSEYQAYCDAVSPCFKHIQPAVNAAQPGDTIKISHGYFDYQTAVITKAGLTISGGYTSTSWIASDADNSKTRLGGYNSVANMFTVDIDNADGDNRPVILENLTMYLGGDSDDDEKATVELYRGNLIIRNSIIEDVHSHAIYADGIAGGSQNRSSLRVENSVIREAEGAGVRAIWYVDVTVENSTINDTYQGIQIGASSSAQIHNNEIFGWYQGVTGGCLQDMSITNNRIRYIVDHGLRLEQGGQYLVTDNQIEQVLPNGSDVVVGPSVYLGNSTICGDVATNVQFDRNVILERLWPAKASALYMEAKSPALQRPLTLSGENNVIQAAHGAVEISGTLSTLAATHWTIRGNGDNTGAQNISGTVSFVNTIFSGFETALSGVGISADYSLFPTSPATCIEGAQCTNSVFGDPRFNGLWQLYDGSAAYNAGLDVGITTDIEGDLRPACGNVDIGADEDNSAESIKQLVFQNTLVADGQLTGVLTWQLPFDVTNGHHDIRYSNQSITDANFADATQLAVVASDITSYAVELPFSEGGQLFFAIVSADTCGTSPVSNNAIPLPYNVRLPLIVAP